MYFSYWFNQKTGELKRCGSPKEEEKLDYFWLRIPEDLWDKMQMVKNFYSKENK